MELLRGSENHLMDILVHASLLSSQQLDLIALKVTRLDRLRVTATIGSTFPGAKKSPYRSNDRNAQRHPQFVRQAGHANAWHAQKCP